MIEVDYRAASAIERKDGFVYIQPLPYGKTGTGESFEAIPPFGLMGRPRGPDENSAPNVLVLRHGPEGFAIAVTDPRYQAGLPDLGEGGAGFYACAEVSGSVQTPYVAFFGKGGEKDEGTFRIEAQTAAGTTVIEVNATSGDVTITHAAGTEVIVKSDAVYLGDESAQPLVKETTLTAWITGTLIPALAQSPGGPIVVTPPAGLATTKTKGT